MLWSLEQEVGDLTFGLIKWNTVLLTAHSTAIFFESSCAALAQLRGDEPKTRYTLWRKTASI